MSRDHEDQSFVSCSPRPGQPAAPLQVDCTRISASPSAPCCLRSTGSALCILPGEILLSGVSLFWKRWLATMWGLAGDPFTVRFGVRNLMKQGVSPQHVSWAYECGVAGSPPNLGFRLSGLPFEADRVSGSLLENGVQCLPHLCFWGLLGGSAQETSCVRKHLEIPERCAVVAVDGDGDDVPSG